MLAKPGEKRVPGLSPPHFTHPLLTLKYGLIFFVSSKSPALIPSALVKNFPQGLKV